MKKESVSTIIIKILFLLPLVCFITYSTIIPVVWNLVLSFQEWDGMGETTFVFFDNYIRLFQDSLVYLSLKNSIVFAISTTLGSVIFGLFLATLIFKITDKSGSFFRLILFSPAMLPIAVVGLMFTFIYSPQMGLLNNFLTLIGLDSLTHVWLQDSATAMPSIIFAAIWKTTGSVMMLCFASMQTVPMSLFESCKLDGGGYFKMMYHVTYPLIKPMILLSTLNTMGSQFKTYNIFQVMTQGGPGTLTYTIPILMTKRAFTYGEFGYAASIGVIFTFVVIICLLITKKLIRSESYEF